MAPAQPKVYLTVEEFEAYKAQLNALTQANVDHRIKQLIAANNSDLYKFMKKTVRGEMDSDNSKLEKRLQLYVDMACLKLQTDILKDQQSTLDNKVYGFFRNNANLSEVFAKFSAELSALADSTKNQLHSAQSRILSSIDTDIERRTKDAMNRVFHNEGTDRILAKVKEECMSDTDKMLKKVKEECRSETRSYVMKTAIGTTLVAAACVAAGSYIAHTKGYRVYKMTKD
jgi:hypothetical protein